MNTKQYRSFIADQRPYTLLVGSNTLKLRTGVPLEFYSCADTSLNTRAIEPSRRHVDDPLQTSNNVARIELKDGTYTVMCLTRGSVDSEKMDEANAIKAVFELIGAKVEFGGSYPGWTPRPGSDIVKLMSAIYRERFKEERHVLACHAGLECGILGTNYPKMEMISFGPTIRGAHSPDERAQISSVQNYWGFLLETLERV